MHIINIKVMRISVNFSSKYMVEKSEEKIMPHYIILMPKQIK